MNGLNVNGISKLYKAKAALEPISLSVQEGKCIALCGGNGAGKSTFLNILASISSPSSGTVLLDGINMDKQKKEYVSLIGYMPDEFYAQGEMRVEEFLSFYADIRAVSKERTEEVITIMGLSDKRKELVKNLSKGMRQRLLAGQAILGEPRLLLMDEPTNGLDPYWINEFIDLIKKLKETGTITVFSTHMMDVAAEVADYVFFIEKGNLTKTLENDFSDIDEFTKKLLMLYRQTF